jgi:hypothetical protein
VELAGAVCRDAFARRRGDPRPAGPELFGAGRAGMPGVVSLVAALALPTRLADGRPFPEGDLLVVLTLCVVLITLPAGAHTAPHVAPARTRPGPVRAGSAGASPPGVRRASRARRDRAARGRVARPLSVRRTPARALEAMALLNLNLNMRNGWSWRTGWTLAGPAGAA